MQTAELETIEKEKPALLDKKKWEGLIAEWEKSKENQKAFCERLGLNHHTFTYMRSKLLCNKNKRQGVNKFIPVKVKEEAIVHHPAAQLTIENKQGIKLHVPLILNEEKLIWLLKLIGWQHA